MSHGDNDDSDDDFDWEEVEVPDHGDQQAYQPEQHLEITIQAAAKPKRDPAKSKSPSHAERVARLCCHQIHTVVLLGNALVRNKWMNDPLLHARLLSLTPLSLHNAFGVIHKIRIPDQNQRGRMFEAAMNNLVEWWSQTFFDVTHAGHLRNRTYDSIQVKLCSLNLPNGDAEVDVEMLRELLGDDGEFIRSPKSLMKHAIMHTGSRDTSAQLFTALCRALGIPARLVVSLQSVPWQAGIGKPKLMNERKGRGRRGKGKGKVAEVNEDVEDVDLSESASTTHSKSKAQAPSKSAKARGKEKAAPLASSNSAGPSSATSSRIASQEPADPTATPPVFWTEVFSRPDTRWLPIDPIRGIVNKRKVFDPAPAGPTAQQASSSLPFPAHSSTGTDSRRSTPLAGVARENRMLYVLAIEEDGFARDVTRRYAREYSAKVAKAQGGSTAGGGGKGRQLWWERVLAGVSRPYRLHRDDLEDAELDAAQLLEGMPTTLAGFKDHPLYVLPRHLRQTEVIHPPPPETVELGRFRGEPVYPRGAVMSLKTAENWMRIAGRMVKTGEQPLKMIKVRASTVNRMRDLEVLKEAGAATGEAQSGTRAGGEVMQGLYARDQTEVYRPEPVIDGKVPKNNFGNIDLYVPSMLPEGAAHIPFKGVAKLARKMNFDFAEAVTGFEFRKRRAFPIVEGIVVARENEALLLEAYWEYEKEEARKEEAKRLDRAIKHWTRLIQGLRIRQRVQDQYVAKDGGRLAVARENGESDEPKMQEDAILGMSASGAGAVGGGGFLTAADDVVQPYHLPRPKYQPIVDESPSLGAGPSRLVDVGSSVAMEMEGMNMDAIFDGEKAERVTYAFHTMDVDDDEQVSEMDQSTRTGRCDREWKGPKTMQELAQDAEEVRRKRLEEGVMDEDEVEVLETGRLFGRSPAKNRNDVVNGKVESTGQTKKRKGRESAAVPGTGNASNFAKRGRGRRRGRGGGNGKGGKTPRRRRKDDEEDESEEDGENNSASNWDDSDDDGEDENAEQLSSSPKKKRRIAASQPRSTALVLAASVAAGARTLRPRKSKTAAQLAEEKNQEEAYRLAIR